MDQRLIERFETYFKHPDVEHDVLKVGDKAIACKNARKALMWLGFARDSGGDPLLFDEKLSDAVTRFQQSARQRNSDGRIGPGTRLGLITSLLEKYGGPQFTKLDKPEIPRPPTVFLSYAWTDAAQVNKLDQWLRDHGVHVVRDVNSFLPGSKIKENIWTSVYSVDKVIAVYSKNSRNRDRPSLEQQLSEEVERLLKIPLLIYLRLDNTPLKKFDEDRIAIESEGMTLKQVGLLILKSLNVSVGPVRYEYNEDEPL